MRRPPSHGARTGLVVVLAAGLVALALGLAACSGGVDDFQEAAEDLIESSPDELGKAYSSAECEEPDSTEVGTTFRCIAFDADARLAQFEAEVSAKAEVTVTLLDDVP